jgi:hypothetical protein
MMNKHARRAISAVATSALVVSLGCSEDASSDANPSTGGGAGTSGAAGVGGGGASGSGGSAGSATVSIYGVVSALGGGQLTEGDACFISEGAADLCAPITPITGLTDPNYEIEGVPTYTVGAVRFRNPEIATSYWVLTTKDRNIEFGPFVETPAVIQGFYDKTGITAAPDGVVVLAEIFPGPKAGYQAVLTPPSGDGPHYYATPYGDIDTSATTTSSSVAMGVFLNVDRKGGPYSTSFTLGAETCDSPSYGGARPPFAVPDDADLVYAPFSCP